MASNRDPGVERAATLPEPGGTITVRPRLRRNPRAPIFYSPIVDVRITDRDIRLLSFTIPPADPEEVQLQDGEYQLPMLSQCELLIPVETAAQLIQALTLQYEAFLRKHQAAPPVELKG